MLKKQIIVWGTGDVCSEFENDLNDTAEIVAYIESSPKGTEYNGRKIYSFSQFMETKIVYDYVVIATVYTNEIMKILAESHIDMQRVIFLRPIENTWEYEIYARNLEPLEKIAPQYLLEALRESGRRMGIDNEAPPVLNCHPLYYYDYFRFRTFELVADQIKNLKGSIAEVGVFRGIFAKLINEKFPEDSFYLFDTFNGFDNQEAAKELLEGNCDRKFINDFQNTSAELVMEKMKYPEKCVIRKGLFPETAKDLECVFKFVSIDVDFEDSTYESLRFFYPKLEKGGFIFIHDYNEGRLKGVKAAVGRYERDYGSIIKIPVADKCGTLIITK